MKKGIYLDPVRPLTQTKASSDRLMLELLSRLVKNTEETSKYIREHIDKNISPIGISNSEHVIRPTSIEQRRSNQVLPLKVVQGSEWLESETIGKNKMSSPNVAESRITNSRQKLSRKKIEQPPSSNIHFHQELLQNQSQHEGMLEKILSSIDSHLKESLDVNKKLLERMGKMDSNTNQFEETRRRKKSIKIEQKNQEDLGLFEKALESKVSNPGGGGANNAQSGKGNYGVLTQILPYSDRRQVKVKFTLDAIIALAVQKDKKDELINEIVEWLGMVYRATASICWNMLLNNYLSFDEVKILFTENILFNYIELMKQVKRAGRVELMGELTMIVKKKSVNILDFLCRQYPQTKIEEPNIALRNVLPQIDKQGKIKYGVIWKSGISVQYRENGQYTDIIMQLLNFMIQKSNDEYNDFNEYMRETFEQVYLPMEKRRKMEEGKVDNSEPDITSEDLKYRDKVKGYTKYLIGKKIHKNTPTYSQEEINGGVFFVKSNPILRIITKWVGQLKEYFQDPDKKIKKNYNQNKDHFGNVLYLSALLKNGLYKNIMEHRKVVFEKIDQINIECEKMEHFLTSEDYTEDSTQVHLSPEQISVGMYSVNIKKVSSAYICAQLNSLIHYLLKIPRDIPQDSLGNNAHIFQIQARKDLDNVNLVSLKLFDLLRCKISSNEEEIIWLVKYLTHQNKYNSKVFKIVRVKDRLSMGTRDIMVNAEIHGGLVCQIQIAVTSTSDKKQELLDYYNHFLYELKRSELGPLNQNVSIWSNLEQRYSHFEQLVAKRTKNRICKFRDVPLKHKCGIGSFVTFKRPLICKDCNSFFPIPRTCLLNVYCGQCLATLCGECYYYDYLDEEERKLYIFNQYRLLKLEVMNKLKEFTDPKKPFPVPGIFIKKNFLKKEISFYMAIQKQKVEGVKDNKNIEIQVVQTVIKNDQIINRQIHKKTIEARLQNGEFYIKNYEKSELNNYLIYYFDKSQPKKMITLSDLKIQLEKPKNSKVKILNIMRQSSYIRDLHLIRKETDKRKELISLEKAMKDHEMVIYMFNNYYLLAQVFIKGSILRADIQKKSNLSELKKFAEKQAQIVAMESKNMTTELDDFKDTIRPILYQTFCKNTKKIFVSNGFIKCIKSFVNFVNLETIFISENNLTSLEGVENCKHLVSCTADNNQLTSLEPLANNPKLMFISANMNKLKSLKGVANLKQLKSLSCYENQISDIDELKDLHKIEILVLRENPIVDLSYVETMVTLKKLYIGKTKPPKLPNFQKLNNLEVLSLQGLNLEEIPIFPNNVHLKDLSLAFNKITKMNNLQNQGELTFLSLAYNQLTKIENIDHLDKLGIIKLRDNKITAIKGLHDLEVLRFAGLKNNPIDDMGDIITYEVKFKYQLTDSCLTEKAKQQIVEMEAAKNNISSSQN